MPSDFLKAARAKAGLTPMPEYSATPKTGLSAMAEYQLDRDDALKAAKKERDEAREEVQVSLVKNALEECANQAPQAKEFYNRAMRRRRERTQRRMIGGSLLVQLSDLHFNAEIKGLEARKDTNEYNFKIAAHRLAAYAEQTIFFGMQHEAKECKICLTGDIFDSRVGKERKDKMFNQETNACKAYQIGKDLLIQFVDTIVESEVFGAVSIHGISGNEARLTEELGFSHIMASDNWDALLNAELKRHYAGSDVTVETAVHRFVVDIEGWKVLLMHGHCGGLDKYCTQKSTQSVLGESQADYGISGHIHDPLVTGKWARSASLIGTEAFAGDGLNLSGKAAQNVHWFAPGQHNCYVVDLQNPDPEVEPFEFFDYGGAFGNS